MINPALVSRRDWLKRAGLLTASLRLSENIQEMLGKKNPTIILVSGWQDVNIGDIAHTPGMLHF
jgi:hypothetical protein